jgi:hypothetical protein
MYPGDSEQCSVQGKASLNGAQPLRGRLGVVAECWAPESERNNGRAVACCCCIDVAFCQDAVALFRAVASGVANLSLPQAGNAVYNQL